MASRSDRPRALLTGCHGFTRRYIAAELETAGYNVVVLAHDGDPPRAGVLRANLLDRVTELPGYDCRVRSRAHSMRTFSSYPAR